MQIASGMAFLHGRRFIHRDIKPDNILLNRSNHAIIADLGFVKKSSNDIEQGGPERRNSIRFYGNRSNVGRKLKIK